jgi:hypothetical protein
MLLVFLLITIYANALVLRRRLPVHECDATAFVLARGAPVLTRGRTFSPPLTIGYNDARVDDTGEGTAMLSHIPPCLHATITPIKITHDSALGSAVAWLDDTCRLSSKCVVYSHWDITTQQSFHVVHLPPN